MDRVLRLDISGMPTAWISQEAAAVLYVKQLVLWEIGNGNLMLFGGINKLTGAKSSLQISPVIATRGDSHGRNLTPGFNNQMLFRRDNYRCMYCGGQFSHAELTRDHVIPRAQGGLDIWENVVAACGGCNQFKADRTPEQAAMKTISDPLQAKHI